MTFHFRPSLALAACVLLSIFLTGCGGSSSSEMASRLSEAYCSPKSSNGAAQSTTVTGIAVYEYRENGNGAASDGGTVISVDTFTNPTLRTYSITVNGRNYTIESDLVGTNAQQDVVTKLKNVINSDTDSGLNAYGISQLVLTQPRILMPPAITSLLRLAVVESNPSPRPIRFGEIAVKDSSGEIVLCSETDDSGNFVFDIPKDTGTYSVEVRSRSLNSRSAVYVLDGPDTNLQHSLTTIVDSSAEAPTLFFRASVHANKLGGAFNILDQLLNAQDYLRTQTHRCDQPGTANYFYGCIPFSNAPLVSVYWAPGFSPSIYLKSTNSISFYLNGRRELYIEGGQNGNVTSSDMDHFDNSVILHEYGHFIEDVFGRSDSPGGSHNGDAIIDPRLAWGEGWANFFQAAVTGEPIYRDTYGTPDCTNYCAGVFYNTSIDPVGTPTNDVPTRGALGEGNFREFSVSRMLWDVIKPLSGTSRFAEIWRIIVTPEGGMRNSTDRFKSVGRVHAIQSVFSGIDSWSPLRLAEEQTSAASVYATPFQIAQAYCATSPTPMAPIRDAWDNGSFATSNQFRNNDFLKFDHGGGSLALELFYSKDVSQPIDLDLYIYKQIYIFGNRNDMVLSSAFAGDGCPFSGSSSDFTNPFRGQNGCPVAPSGISSTYGYEKSSVALASGTYMINVQADTTNAIGGSSNYVLLLNGQIVCPSP